MTAAPGHSRITETAMAILQATPEGRLGITVLNKALFYADLCAIRDLGHSLTHSGFIALPQGPVLNHYERALIRDLDRHNLAEQQQDGPVKPMIVRQAIKTFVLLSDEEVGIAQLVGRKIHARSATWVSDYSHENIAWQQAFQTRTGTAIDMTLALQQVIEDDPWMLEEVTEDASTALLDAATDDGVPF